MVDYKKYITEHKDFPIKGINYLDMNPIYKDGQLRARLVEDCIKSLSIDNQRLIIKGLNFFCSSSVKSFQCFL